MIVYMCNGYPVGGDLNSSIVTVTLLASAIIPLTLDGSNASLRGLSIACTSAVWLMVIGVGTIFSALFAKASRINKIMRSAHRCRRIKVGIRETLMPIFVLLSGKLDWLSYECSEHVALKFSLCSFLHYFLVNAVILSLMTFLDPIEYHIKVVSEDVSNSTILCFCVLFTIILTTDGTQFASRSVERWTHMEVADTRPNMRI
jgi:hypothetical protein